MDLALNNLQRLISHKTQPTNTYIYTHTHNLSEKKEERVCELAKMEDEYAITHK